MCGHNHVRECGEVHVITTEGEEEMKGKENGRREREEKGERDKERGEREREEGMEEKDSRLLR